MIMTMSNEGERRSVRMKLYIKEISEQKRKWWCQQSPARRHFFLTKIKFNSKMKKRSSGKKKIEFFLLSLSLSPLRCCRRENLSISSFICQNASLSEPTSSLTLTKHIFSFLSFFDLVSSKNVQDDSRRHSWNATTTDAAVNATASINTFGSTTGVVRRDGRALFGAQTEFSQTLVQR